VTGDTPRRRQLGARAVHRVTPDDLGQRVSVRHLVDDPERGQVATDFVGRLLGYTDGLLSLVDRDAQLVLVSEAAVVSSRVVPPHPRLPAEPEGVGTRDHPLRREAARAVVLDADDRLLLVRFRPSPDHYLWSAPGGGLLPGEDHRTAAVRELREELGRDVTVGPWIWSRRETFAFAGVWLDQAERWFLARTDRFEAADAPLDDPGTVQARWWTLDELRDTDEELAPTALADHLEALLTDGPPDSPIEVGR
jgi:8-oxo-dGTP pyrophosphatase MutT (NUDIX family)